MFSGPAAMRSHPCFRDQNPCVCSLLTFTMFFACVLCYILRNNLIFCCCCFCFGPFAEGTYFARDAAYSSRFCKDDIKHGNTFQIHGVSLQQRHLFRTYKSMFLARVLIGDYINGDSKYMRPPSKDGSYVNLYDSCVDDTWNPRIFVVFDANQIYPEYLIDFH